MTHYYIYLCKYDPSKLDLNTKQTWFKHEPIIIRHSDLIQTSANHNSNLIQTSAERDSNMIKLSKLWFKHEPVQAWSEHDSYINQTRSVYDSNMIQKYVKHDSTMDHVGMMFGLDSNMIQNVICKARFNHGSCWNDVWIRFEHDSEIYKARFNHGSCWNDVWIRFEHDSSMIQAWHEHDPDSWNSTLCISTSSLSNWLYKITSIQHNVNHMPQIRTHDCNNANDNYG